MRMMITGFTAFLIAVLGWSLPLTAQSEDAPYQIEVVAEGLVYPWSLAFLPGGEMLVTERPGRVRRLSAAGELSEPLSGVPEVLFVSKSQAGLFDIVPHPNFAENGFVYFAYSYGPQEENALRLSRARLANDALENVEVLFTAEPTRTTGAHFGGRILFLPDDTLLLTVGDGFDYREQAQVLENHIGTFVRLNDDGSIPADNPFIEVEGARPEIWSYGHRNPQGLTRDPVSGAIYSTEHGPQGGDELNLIRAGENYGWPVATHGLDYSNQLVTPFTTYEGMVDPLLSWVPSIAPSGLAVYRGAMFPEWDGDLLAGALIPGDAPEGVTGHVRRIELEDGEVVDEEILFAEISERVREVRIADDGSIWILTDAKARSILTPPTLTSQVLRISRRP